MLWDTEKIFTNNFTPSADRKYIENKLRDIKIKGRSWIGMETL